MIMRLWSAKKEKQEREKVQLHQDEKMIKVFSRKNEYEIKKRA
jgi:hypothetical protein